MYITGKKLRVAILDLYNGEPNEGMRCIRQILNKYAEYHKMVLRSDEFNVRQKLEIADTSYHIYISTGGPGDPLESRGSHWEKIYFSLMDKLERINASSPEKKYVFFICHSFQLMCRHYTLGKISKRRSPAFGIFPVYKTADGEKEILFRQLADPFFAVDSREWQVTEPDKKQLKATGARLLALEKERPHVPFERALMAVRYSDFFFGTQFHPEADPAGMSSYLQQEESRVITESGDEKYNKMRKQLHDPDKIILTQQAIIPAFLDLAVSNLYEITSHNTIS